MCTRRLSKFIIARRCQRLIISCRCVVISFRLYLLLPSSLVDVVIIFVGVGGSSLDYVEGNVASDEVRLHRHPQPSDHVTGTFYGRTMRLRSITAAFCDPAARLTSGFVFCFLSSEDDASIVSLRRRFRAEAPVEFSCHVPH